ncbi:MAG: Twin-arginine translocation pathway signal sequence domain-containing protein, partial [Pseudomonadota bacterium]
MTNSLSLSRRRLLSAIGVGAAALPSLNLPGFVQAAGQPPGSGGILVLIELAGGNDGLNTVVPVTDPAYRGLRPEIGLARDETLRLDADTGLHPEMRAMADLWERGELSIVEGVGYPNPNRSHFRSIEIWNA